MNNDKRRFTGRLTLEKFSNSCNGDPFGLTSLGRATDKDFERLTRIFETYSQSDFVLENFLSLHGTFGCLVNRAVLFTESVSHAEAFVKTFLLFQKHYPNLSHEQYSKYFIYDDVLAPSLLAVDANELSKLTESTRTAMSFRDRNDGYGWCLLIGSRVLAVEYGIVFINEILEKFLEHGYLHEDVSVFFNYVLSLSEVKDMPFDWGVQYVRALGS